MATIKEILNEFHRHKQRFNAIRTSNGWCVIDLKLNGDKRGSVVARDTDGEKIARLVKLLNGASDVNE